MHSDDSLMSNGPSVIRESDATIIVGGMWHFLTKFILLRRPRESRDGLWIYGRVGPGPAAVVGTAR